MSGFDQLRNVIFLLNLSEDSSVKLQNRSRYAMIVGTNSRMPEKEAGFYMRKRLLAVILCASMLFPASVYAEV